MGLYKGQSIKPVCSLHLRHIAPVLAFTKGLLQSITEILILLIWPLISYKYISDHHLSFLQVEVFREFGNKTIPLEAELHVFQQTS